MGSVHVVKQDFETKEDFYKSVNEEYSLDMTPKHQEYLNTMKKNTMTFGIGPAGTGKTLFATKYALDQLKAGNVKRIVITRPHVEVGSKMGHLPGLVEEKVAPYLQPIYDAMNEIDDPVLVRKFIDDGKIKVEPIAFVRGKTFHEALILIDEAQNLTKVECLTLFTRIGKKSQIIVTGDLRQMDIKPSHSGLMDSINRLHLCEKVGVHEFSTADIKRCDFVRDVIEQYELSDENIEKYKFKNN
jgi:phosphate starvation-inducible PhoH-like protein